MKRNLVLIYLIFTIDFIIGTMIGTFLPVFVRAESNQTFLLSLAFALFAFAQLISAPIQGIISDKLGRKPILMLSTIGTLMSLVFLLPVRSLGLMVNRVSDGFTNGVYSTVRSTIADIAPEDKVQKYIGIAETISSFGIIIGPAFASIIILIVGSNEVTQVNAVILTSIALAVLNIFLVYLFQESLKMEFIQKLKFKELVKLIFANVNPLVHLKKISHLVRVEPKIGYLIIIQMFVLCGIGYYMYFIAFVSGGELKFTTSDISIFTLYLGILLTVINMLFFGFIIKYVNTRRQALISLMALIFTTIAYTFIDANKLLLYILITLDLIFSAYLFGILSGILAESVDEKRRGEIFGLVQAGSSIASFFTAFVFTILSAINLELPFLWFAFSFLCAAILYYRFLKLK